MEDGAQGRGMTRLGVLKVVVASGTNLAIRDFTSSDPYVVVRLADKHAKTKVINSCLNPVWNEEMVFSIEEPVGVIKFEVFDRDRFKSDDKMGHAFLDLQRWLGRRSCGARSSSRREETKLRKVAPKRRQLSALRQLRHIRRQGDRARLPAAAARRGVWELFVIIKWIEADAK
ncbi:hypothetical protein QYE76_004125 [Lolium multiflorum]|uniref:C2 domain-containing protein n=1 Tax=Lolium multiflorum TaxID=4521 RepID=A0AAD8RQK4_LOLMU|nr:hypothetical protein QYE76_004125 [Lolium multiflorum]